MSKLCLKGPFYAWGSSQDFSEFKKKFRVSFQACHAPSRLARIFFRPGRDYSLHACSSPGVKIETFLQCQRVPFLYLRDNFEGPDQRSSRLEGRYYLKPCPVTKILCVRLYPTTHERMKQSSGTVVCNILRRYSRFGWWIRQPADFYATIIRQCPDSTAH